MNKLACSLGWLSVGLGFVNLVMPTRLARGLGLGRRANIFRSVGARELVSAAMLLSPRLAKWGAWSRVAGDVMDSAMLMAAPPRTKARMRYPLVMGTLLAIGLLDILSARRLSRR
jgi:hypothetical protein